MHVLQETETGFYPELKVSGDWEFLFHVVVWTLLWQRMRNLIIFLEASPSQGRFSKYKSSNFDLILLNKWKKDLHDYLLN